MLTACLTDEICQSRRIREHRLYSRILLSSTRIGLLCMRRLASSSSYWHGLLKMQSAPVRRHCDHQRCQCCLTPG